MSFSARKRRTVAIIIFCSSWSDLALRQRIRQELFGAVLAAMGPLFDKHRLGCQLEVTEFDADVSVYQNNLAATDDPAEPSVCGPVP